MNRINNILKSVTFKRILVIFVVGLVSRLVVNWCFDVNVFKDYSNVTFSIYWGFIVGFLTVIDELPHMSFNVFNYKLIKSGVRIYLDNILKSGDKLICGVDSFNKNPKVDSSYNQLVYTQNDSG
jgi:hypothetical protein